MTDTAPAPAYRWLAPLMLIIIGGGVFANALQAPFLLDDVSAIVRNPNIQRIWVLTDVFSGPPQSRVAARPVVALSLAVNYLLSGRGVWSYHALNIAAHVSSALVLLGIVRRTLRGRAPMRHIEPVSAAIALLWLVHPLHTEAVSYISHRSHVLAGLFTLLTLYCAIRAATAGASRFRWTLASIISCAAGMASMETAVVTPLVVLAYDAAFGHRRFLELLRTRGTLYLGLAGTWVLLAMLLATGGRDETMGFDLGVTWYEYLLTQFWAVLRYVQLAVWPSGLCLDYGPVRPVEPALTVFGGALVLAILGVTVWAWLSRRRWTAFWGTWFILTLAPLSSFVPVVINIASESRMYLPLAAMPAMAVLAFYKLTPFLREYRPHATLGITCLAAAGLSWATIQRNTLYNEPLLLWNDTIDQQPDNARAYIGLGDTLLSAGQVRDAVTAYRNAVRLNDNSVTGRVNLGYALYVLGYYPEAAHHLAWALRLKPENAVAHYNLGLTLSKVRQFDDADRHCREALRLAPRDPQSHASMGTVIVTQGRPAEAVAYFERALSLSPRDASMHFNLALVLSMVGRHDEAIEHLETAVKLNPDDVEAKQALATARTQSRRS